MHKKNKLTYEPALSKSGFLELDINEIRPDLN